MKTLLFLGINARWTHSNLALYYLKSLASQYPYKSILLEETINRDFLEILDNTYSKKPDIIAISVYIWNTDYVRKILANIKKILPEIKIVLGGPEVSHNAEKWIQKFKAIDYIVVGAGEKGFELLLKNDFDYKSSIIKLKNYSFNKISFPYAKNDLKSLKNKYVYYESSRGCPYKCSFCLSSLENQALDYRDLSTVKQELALLLKQNFKIIKFVDRTFNANQLFAREIWQFLTKFKEKTRFHFEIHPQLLAEEDFQIFRKLKKNKFQFEIGIQSLNTKTLTEINRKQNWKLIKNNIIRLIEMQNIHIHLDLIAGLPYEDYQTFQKSFNQVIGLKPDHLQLGFLKVLPGTEMEKSSRNYQLNYMKTPPYHILSNRWIAYSEIRILKKIALIVDILYNSHKFELTIENLLHQYKNPFSCFYDLISIFSENWSNRRWKFIANLLLKFIQNKFPQQVKFYQDCLRWDWCQITKSHYYPDFLASKQLWKLKKSGYQYFKQFSEKGMIKYNSYNFTIQQLKKAVFFKAESDEFSKIYLRKYKQGIFIELNDDKQLIEFEL